MYKLKEKENKKYITILIKLFCKIKGQVFDQNSNNHFIFSNSNITVDPLKTTLIKHAHVHKKTNIKTYTDTFALIQILHTYRVRFTQQGKLALAQIP